MVVTEGDILKMLDTGVGLQSPDFSPALWKKPGADPLRLPRIPLQPRQINNFMQYVVPLAADMGIERGMPVTMRGMDSNLGRMDKPYVISLIEAGTTDFSKFSETRLEQTPSQFYATIDTATASHNIPIEEMIQFYRDIFHTSVMERISPNYEAHKVRFSGLLVPVAEDLLESGYKLADFGGKRLEEL